MDYNFIGKTIMIVEDEGVNQFFFEKALKKTQANLFFVNNGLEAIEMIQENSEIDLVLMDVRLPGMNGIEATAKIKQINPEMPVIIQTANALPSVYESAIESGCNEFITKPIKIETLLTILKKYLLY
jgi:two-component system, cell cycle response regulator DivK